MTRQNYATLIAVLVVTAGWCHGRNIPYKATTVGASMVAAVSSSSFGTEAEVAVSSSSLTATKTTTTTSTTTIFRPPTCPLSCDYDTPCLDEGGDDDIRPKQSQVLLRWPIDQHDDNDMSNPKIWYDHANKDTSILSNELHLIYRHENDFRHPYDDNSDKVIKTSTDDNPNDGWICTCFLHHEHDQQANAVVDDVLSASSRFAYVRSCSMLDHRQQHQQRYLQNDQPSVAPTYYPPRTSWPTLIPSEMNNGSGSGGGTTTTEKPSNDNHAGTSAAPVAVSPTNMSSFQPISQSPSRSFVGDSMNPGNGNGNSMIPTPHPTPSFDNNTPVPTPNIERTDLTPLPTEPPRNNNDMPSSKLVDLHGNNDNNSSTGGSGSGSVSAGTIAGIILLLAVIGCIVYFSMNGSGNGNHGHHGTSSNGGFLRGGGGGGGGVSSNGSHWAVPPNDLELTSTSRWQSTRVADSDELL